HGGLTHVTCTLRVAATSETFKFPSDKEVQMRKHSSPRLLARTIALAAGAAMALAGCSAGSLGSSSGDGVLLTFLVSSNQSTVSAAEALAEAFMQQNPDITVEVETRPGGSEGDNIVKTRLATGDMSEVFLYNSGSLFQAIGPEQNLTPVTDQPWVGALEENFKRVVSATRSTALPSARSSPARSSTTSASTPTSASRSRARGTSSWPTTPRSRRRASTRSSRPTATPTPRSCSCSATSTTSPPPNPTSPSATPPARPSSRPPRPR